jgi:hypothetical protein
MMFLPRALSAISDARTAFARLSLVFNAPLRETEPFVIDRDAKQEGKAGMGVWARGAAWVWEAGVKPEEDDGKDKKKKHSKHSEKEKEKALDADSDLEPFALRDISLAVPRGSLAAIVGRVGSGKSSLLQGLIGEMRSTAGTPEEPAWAFGGSVAYCPQTAWIQNASLVSGSPYIYEFFSRIFIQCLSATTCCLAARGTKTNIGVCWRTPVCCPICSSLRMGI